MDRDDGIFDMGNDILDDVLKKENYIFEREDAIFNIKVNTNFIEYNIVFLKWIS